MSSNPFKILGTSWRIGALLGVLTLATGCGMTIAGPGETISVQPLATEDLAGSCQFDMNLPDEPFATAGQQPDPGKPEPKQVAALVIYERGDSANLFNDEQVQNMAATLHMVTVFAHQCNSKVTGDIQGDATKGPGRALFAALSQYSIDTRHPEIANVQVVLSGFSAAGVLSTTMANAYPNRILGFIPFASGDPFLDLDSVPVSPAAARIPALVLANAYDPAAGVQRSLRYFQRGWAQGAPWGFGVQNHTGHCCTLSTRDVMVPWVTALVQPLQTGQPTAGASGSTAPSPVNWAQTAANGPTVRFLCYTDGYYDSYGQSNCWIPSASVLPNASGGPQAGWLPDANSSAAWLKWVTSPGTN